MINRDRLWHRLMALGEVGKQADGGVTRLSFSEEESAAKNLVHSWMEEAGLEVWEDAVGNLFGRKVGTDPNAPVVLTGSHVDSVFHGGNFDGPLGVLSAVEALQSMNERGIQTARSIEAVAFTDEEGARFRFGMIGSRAVAGTLRQNDLEKTDSDGVTIADAMRKVGLHPEQIATAQKPKHGVKAYVEVHIEQGKVLEEVGLPVGVVTGIAGPLWLKFTLTGHAGHAGTTPMGMRNDAVVGASRIIEAIRNEAAKEQRTVATVGQLTLYPGGVNIIPGKAEFTLDLRDTDMEVRKAVEDRMVRRAREVCAQEGLSLTAEVLQDIPPVHCADLIQNATLQACEAVQSKTMKIVSGAGHDAMNMHDLCPVGMIFVRSKDGISHHSDEWSSPEDCATGAEVLYHTLLALSGQD